MKRIIPILMAILLFVTIMGCSKHMHADALATTGPLPSFTATAEPSGVTEPTPEDPGDIGNGGAPTPESTEPTVNNTTEATEPTIVDIPDPTVPATDAPTEPTFVFTEVNKTVYAVDSVNVRSGPGTSYEKLGRLSRGDAVTCTGIGDNGWYRIEYNNEPAYVAGNYLSEYKPVDETVPPQTNPPETTLPATEPPETEPAVKFTDVDEIVYANTGVNIRTGPGTEYEKVGSLNFGEEIRRTGIGDNGWSRVIYDGETAYMFSDYIQTEKPKAYYDGTYPMTYSDGTCTITIYREWYENAWCYAAHVVFSDYSRFGTSCANGAYDNGYESTSGAASRLGAILAVNGCYSAPYLNYTVVRSGVLWDGADKDRFWVPAVYSSNNGLLLSAWESGGTPGIAGANINDLVADGTVTDTFCFGPPILSGGWCSTNEDDRAQRTFIGTNGNAGDIWLVVSDGRYNDGESAGLTYGQCARYLASKGCTFGVPLDGGGSSTMVFQGKVLNAARGNQRYVVDFVYFK